MLDFLRVKRLSGIGDATVLSDKKQLDDIEVWRTTTKAIAAVIMTATLLHGSILNCRRNDNIRLRFSAPRPEDLDILGMSCIKSGMLPLCWACPAHFSTPKYLKLMNCMSDIIDVFLERPVDVDNF